MRDTHDTRTDQLTDPGRRTVLGRASLLAAAGLLWRPQASAAQRGHGASLQLDVAVLGESNAPNFEGALDLSSGDLRGISFNLEGLIYPHGTIAPGAGFDPASAAPMGHWLSRGWVMAKPDRRFPVATVSQEFLLGMIQPDAPLPADTISTSGVEKSPYPAVMSIVGGTGRYRHVRGEVVVQSLGTNTTVLNKFGSPAPNFSFDFRF